jgi:hypothetical protein
VDISNVADGVASIIEVISSAIKAVAWARRRWGRKPPEPPTGAPVKRRTRIRVVELDIWE